MNFTQIAEHLGYTSIHYFSRQFKKVVGMTPSEYASSIKAMQRDSSQTTLILNFLYLILNLHGIHNDTGVFVLPDIIHDSGSPRDPEDCLLLLLYRQL